VIARSKTGRRFMEGVFMKTVTKLVGIITALAVIGLITGCPTDGGGGSSSRTLGNIRKIELRTGAEDQVDYHAYAIEGSGDNLLFDIRMEKIKNSSATIKGEYVVSLFYYDNSKNMTHVNAGLGGSEAMHAYIFTNGVTLSDLGIFNEGDYIIKFNTIPKYNFVNEVTTFNPIEVPKTFITDNFQQMW